MRDPHPEGGAQHLIPEGRNGVSGGLALVPCTRLAFVMGMCCAQVPARWFPGNASSVTNQRSSSFHPKHAFAQLVGDLRGALDRSSLGSLSTCLEQHLIAPQCERHDFASIHSVWRRLGSLDHLALSGFRSVEQGQLGSGGPRASE